MRFDDMCGKEQLCLHAESDQLTEVEHDEDKWAGNDRRKIIDRDETSHLEHNRTETVDNNETITDHNNRSEQADKNETVGIGGNRVKTIVRNRNDVIGKAWSTHVARMKTETVGIVYMLTLARIRSGNAPSFELFTSTVAQLEHVLSVMKGDKKDLSRLKDIIVGHFAVREFEESNPEFAQALKAVQFIASKGAKGVERLRNRFGVTGRVPARL